MHIHDREPKAADPRMHPAPAKTPELHGRPSTGPGDWIWRQSPAGRQQSRGHVLDHVLNLAAQQLHLFLIAARPGATHCHSAANNQ
jgi:hypothetical protein